MDFSTLDELATWMLTNIRLSRYDDQFVNNLTLYITQHNRITSNQDELFRKVALKYTRQFKQQKVDIVKQLSNTWSVGIVQSIPEYTGANIKVVDNKIIFRSPYNKNFLAALRKNPIYSLTWIKDVRQYESDFSLTVLKQLLYLSNEHFEIINYCPVITNIVNTLSQYEDAKYWTPTLVKNNYIAAINEPLYEAIKHIEINTDLKTIAELASYGIKIHSDITDSLEQTIVSEKVKIASNFSTEFEIKHLDILIDWLREFGCDAICEPRSFVITSFPANIKDKIIDNNIDIVKNIKDCVNYKKPVVLYVRGSLALIDDQKPTRLFKVIKLVNSEPIIIR